MDVDKGKDIFGAGAQFSLKKLVSVRFPIAKLLCSFKILSHGWNTCHGQVSWKWKRACFKSLDRHLTETEHWDLGQKWRTFHVGYRFRVSVCTHERGVAEAVGLSSRGKHGNEKQWHDKTERGQTGRQKNTGSPLFFRLSWPCLMLIIKTFHSWQNFWVLRILCKTIKEQIWSCSLFYACRFGEIHGIPFVDHCWWNWA